MLPDDPQLKSQYRMPRVFGALPGPRNVPRDKQHLENAQRNTIMSVSARTDSGALEALRLDVDLALARQAEEGRAHRDAVQSARGGLDVGEGDGKRRRTHASDRTRARIPSRP